MTQVVVRAGFGVQAETHEIACLQFLCDGVKSTLLNPCAATYLVVHACNISERLQDPPLSELHLGALHSSTLLTNRKNTATCIGCINYPHTSLIRNGPLHYL